MTTIAIQNKIDHLNNLCHNYYRSIEDEDAKSEINSLIVWVGEVLTGRLTVTSDDIITRFSSVKSMFDATSGLRDPRIIEIVDSLIEINRWFTVDESDGYTIVQVRLNWRWPPSSIDNMNDLVAGLIDGSIEQPKIPFDQPRIVTIIDGDDCTPELNRRAHDDEIDTLRRNSRVVIVEPSMMPAAYLMWDEIDAYDEQDENVIIDKIEQYRRSLVSLLSRRSMN